jgi:hypothetical protein
LGTEGWPWKRKGAVEGDKVGFPPRPGGGTPASEQGLPKDLVGALLPADESGFRIDGRWSVEGEVLTMTDLAVDGIRVEQSPRTLRTMCTPVIRIQAADHQYMFARGTAETARSQGKIPDWPAGTASVRGSVSFEKDVAGWLTVGYTGFNNDGKRLDGSVTLRIHPDQRSPRATTQGARISRLAQTSSGFATTQYMAIPPGNYLLYAMWQPPDPRVLAGEVVIEFSRFKLESPFAARWVSVTGQPLSGINLDITAGPRSTIDIQTPASEAYQSVFALPWPETDASVPQLDDQQAWELAWSLGTMCTVESNKARFDDMATARYRLFLIEHDKPFDDEGAWALYRVVAEKAIVVSHANSTKVVF